MKAKKYFTRAVSYADKVISGETIAGADIVNACKRFKEDLERDDIEIRTTEADAACSIMEGLFVHRKGEAIDGTPLLGKPFILEDWEIFIIYNLLAMYYKGTNERRFKEAFIMLARKNGKTSFIAALAFAVSIIQRKSGSTVYVVAAALKQALESFKFIDFSLRYKKIQKTDVQTAPSRFKSWRQTRTPRIHLTVTLQSWTRWQPLRRPLSTTDLKKPRQHLQTDYASASQQPATI